MYGEPRETKSMLLSLGIRVAGVSCEVKLVYHLDDDGMLQASGLQDC